MADQVANQARFLRKRVQALAVMYLTRRKDLIVEEASADTGLDLIARFVPEGKEGTRQFGVALRGVWSSGTQDQIGKLLGRSLREVQRSGPFAFPVSLFFFTMEGNQGWYAWVAEPVVEAGRALLHL